MPLVLIYPPNRCLDQPLSPQLSEAVPVTRTIIVHHFQQSCALLNSISVLGQDEPQLPFSLNGITFFPFVSPPYQH